ncbi:MAG TPA: hypothetical protein VLT33_20355 [Labilithrix sp.]|nr:hypothetical protein [Labilithrix sp.]
MRCAGALALALTVACSRRTPDAGPVSDAAPATPSASAPDAAPPWIIPLDDANRKILTAWNDALDRHDLPALERIYAPGVGFYGHLLPRATVLEIKKRALGPKSTFRQSIVSEPTMMVRGDAGDIKLRTDGADTIFFVKRTSNQGKTRDTRASVVVRDGLVLEESDALAYPPFHGIIAVAVDASSPSEICHEAASKAVDALPAVQQMMRKRSTVVPAAPPGALVGSDGPVSEPGGGFSVFFDLQAGAPRDVSLWYTVDADGRLSVALHGETLAVPAAALEAVERACKLP